jgi:hypothetical protein
MLKNFKMAMKEDDLDEERDEVLLSNIVRGNVR